MQNEAERDLIEWANVTGDRDNRVCRAIAAGIEKVQIHRLTGISRATIDRILKEHAMTTTTTIPGPSGDKERDGWYAFIADGGYTEEQSEELAEALMREEMNEFNALLPESWTWFASTNEIVLPFEQRDAAEMDFNELLQQASEAVIARIGEIEATALASVIEA